MSIITAFVCNALQLPVFLLLILLVLLHAMSGTLELQIGIPDFENLSIWRTEVVNSSFSKVFM